MSLNLSKEIGVNVSKRANTSFFLGNQFMTASRQSARGHQDRTNYPVSDKEAMKVVHTKMIVGVGGIVASPFLFKIHPVLGILSAAVGIFELFDVREDWKVGFCKEGENCI